MRAIHSLTLEAMEQIWMLEQALTDSGGDYMTWLLSDITIDRRIDKAMLSGVMYSELGALSPRFPDNGRFKKVLTGWFFGKQYWIKGMLDSQEFDYNPIHNYDRHEEYSGSFEDQERRNIDNSETGKDVGSTSSNTITNRDGEASDHVSANQTTTNSVSAYNSPGYLPKDQSVMQSETSGNGTTSENSDVNESGSSTMDRTNNIATTDNKNGTGNDSHNIYAYGNIGVTTTQALIEQQRNVIDFDVYAKIVDAIFRDLFKKIY